MKNRGFTLIEILMGLFLSLIVVAGVTAALTGINSGVRNASRSSDLTNNIRGVFQILQRDVYLASRGVGDVNLLQVHFNNPNAIDETLFYGISSIDEDTGDSELVLQYFDYDYTAAGVDGNPTFVVDWLGSNGNEDWPPNIPPLHLMSAIANDPALADVQQGDLFLLYSSDPVYRAEINALALSLNGGAFYNELLMSEGGVGNGAFLLQVVAIEPTAPDDGFDCGGDEGGYQSAIRVAFGGTTFVNDFAANPVRTKYTEPAIKCPRMALIDQDSGAAKLGWVKPPNGTWLARKLGDATAYHRVVYSVDNGTLIRNENGVDMILASNVTDFTIDVGLDIRPGAADPWDGSVSVLDTDYWIRDMDVLAGVRDESRAYLGRHALSMRTSITFESLFVDQEDTTAQGSGNRKVRTLTNQIRIKNQHLPLRNL